MAQAETRRGNLREKEKEKRERKGKERLGQILGVYWQLRCHQLLQELKV
jgi:hypothetical protein